MAADLISARAVVRMLRKERQRLLNNAANTEARGGSATWMHDRATALLNVVPDIHAMAARARKRKAKR